MSKFDEEECIVVELRPAGDRYMWQEWLADRQGWDLVDAQVIKPAAGTDTKFAKLVYRGERNSILKLWKQRVGITIVFQGVVMNLKPVGLGQFDPTKFGPIGKTDTKAAPEEQYEDFEFDTHADNEANHNRREGSSVKEAVESMDILAVIDELAAMLPLAQKAFASFACKLDGTDAMISTECDNITPYAACKAIGTVLHVNVMIPDLCIDGNGDVRDIQAHSAVEYVDSATNHPAGPQNIILENIVNKLGEKQFPPPTIRYTQFLYCLLRLKRLKDDDPNIISPRHSARGSARRGTGIGKSLGGDGDTFGKSPDKRSGSPRSKTINGGSPRSPRSHTLYSPRNSMELDEVFAKAGLSGGVVSPRKYPNLSTNSTPYEESKMECGGGKGDGARSEFSEEEKERRATVLWGNASSKNATEAPVSTSVVAPAKLLTTTSSKLSRKEDAKADALRRRRIQAMETNKYLIKNSSSVGADVAPMPEPPVYLDMKDSKNVQFTERKETIGDISIAEPKGILVVEPVNDSEYAKMDPRQKFKLAQQHKDEAAKENAGNAEAAVISPSALLGKGKPVLSSQPHGAVPPLSLKTVKGASFSIGTSPRMDSFIENQAQVASKNAKKKLPPVQLGAGSTVGAGAVALERRVVELSEFPQPASRCDPKLWFASLHFYEHISQFASMFETNRPLVLAGCNDSSDCLESTIYAPPKSEWYEFPSSTTTPPVTTPTTSGGKFTPTKSTSHLRVVTKEESKNGSPCEEAPNTDADADADNLLPRSADQAVEELLAREASVAAAANEKEGSSEHWLQDGKTNGKPIACIVNRRSKAYKAVRRAFHTMDVSCFYSQETEENELQIFNSDLPNLMKTLKIQATVVQRLDLTQVDSQLNPHPVLGCIANKHTEKDVPTGIRTGTGSTFWTCLPSWWQAQWKEYMTLRVNLREQQEKIKRRMTNRQARKKGRLNAQETADLVAATHACEVLLAEEEEEKSAMKQLSWQRFTEFLQWIVFEVAVKNVNKLRRNITSEIWLNTKKTVTATIVAKCKADPTGFMRDFFSSDEEKIQMKEAKTDDLFVGYFPKSAEDIKYEERMAELARLKELDKKEREKLRESEAADSKREEEKIGHEQDAKHTEEMAPEFATKEEELDSEGKFLKVELERVKRDKEQEGKPKPGDRVKEVAENGGSIAAMMDAAFEEEDDEEVAEKKFIKERHRQRVHAELANAEKNKDIAEMDKKQKDFEKKKLQEEEAKDSAIERAKALIAASAAAAIQAEAEASAIATSEAEVEEDKTKAEISPAASPAVNARERFRLAQARKQQEADDAVADMLKMAADRDRETGSTAESPSSSPVKAAGDESPSKPLSARERIKLAKENAASGYTAAAPAASITAAKQPVAASEQDNDEIAEEIEG